MLQLQQKMKLIARETELADNFSSWHLLCHYRFILSMFTCSISIIFCDYRLIMTVRTRKICCTFIKSLEWYWKNVKTILHKWSFTLEHLSSIKCFMTSSFCHFNRSNFSWFVILKMISFFRNFKLCLVANMIVFMNWLLRKNQWSMKETGIDLYDLVLR